MRAKRISKMAISKGIGRYIDELDYERSSRFVVLGRGISTDDPAVVDERADKLEAELGELTSTIARLKLRQRISDLRAAADEMRARADAPSFREHFVSYAADWALENGISYATFRDFGVPAEVLREAGIER